MTHATTPVSTGLPALVDARWRAIARLWRRAARGDVRAIHRMRTMSRRLREVLPIAAAAAPEARADRARRAARRITRALGAVRELDVALAVLREDTAREWPPAAVRRVERRLTGARVRALRSLQRRLGALDRDRWRQRGRRLRRGLERPLDEGAWRRALAERLRRRGVRLVEAIDAAGDQPAADVLHRVRIATKKLRYALELARDLAGCPADRDLAVLRRAQGDLGRMHDLARLVELAGRATTRTAGGRALVAAVGHEARGRHEAYLASRDVLRSLARRAAREAAVHLVGRATAARMTMDRPAAGVARRAGRRP